MSMTSAEQNPHTLAAEASGTILTPEEAMAGRDVTLLDISDPQFMATAYDTYNELRNKERVSGADVDAIFKYLQTSFGGGKPEVKIPPAFLEGGCTPF